MDSSSKSGDTSSLHPQDIDLSTLGGASANMNLQIRGPLALAGSMVQDIADTGQTKSTSAA